MCLTRLAALLNLVFTFHELHADWPCRRPRSHIPVPVDCRDEASPLGFAEQLLLLTLFVHLPQRVFASEVDNREHSFLAFSGFDNSVGQGPGSVHR